MALDAVWFMRTGTRGSPSWPRQCLKAGYVDADCSDQIAEIACGPLHARAVELAFELGVLRREVGRRRPSHRPGPGRPGQRPRRLTPDRRSPGPQHRWLDAQLSRELGQWSATAFEQGYRLALELRCELSPRLARRPPSRPPSGAYQRCPPMRGRITGSTLSGQA